MNVLNKLLRKVDIYDFAQRIQRNSVQRTLHDTVTIKSNNIHKDNAERFFKQVMYENV